VFVPGAIVIIARRSQQFAAMAAPCSLAEVQLGPLAAETGDRDAVRAFGRRMASEHEKARYRLQMIAARENIDLPTGLDDVGQQNYEKLAKLSEPALAVAYAGEHGSVLNRLRKRK
jgi:predicted outer membrane protein